jgi:hypothetical protein
VRGQVGLWATVVAAQFHSHLFIKAERDGDHSVCPAVPNPVFGQWSAEHQHARTRHGKVCIRAA